MKKLESLIFACAFWIVLMIEVCTGQKEWLYIIPGVFMVFWFVVYMVAVIRDDE